MSALIQIELDLVSGSALYNFPLDIIRLVVIYRGDLPAHLFELATIEVRILSMSKRCLESILFVFGGLHHQAIAKTVRVTCRPCRCRYFFPFQGLFRRISFPHVPCDIDLLALWLFLSR